ncbi:MAG TPA: type II toxin-antitoxin system VapB family antitoxin [Rhodoblastus sp.]|mgnify:CR=1 FL=1|nr:type II toxin-antitoxin system VapB family antitoxin [Rhodoblastus sp.]
MGLNIKNPETERLIAELARLEGRSKTAVVTEAVRERLERLEKDGRGDFVEDVLAIGRDCASRLDPETLALDHGEYLYDENGLPK